MASNRRRGENTVAVGVITKWIIAVAFVGVMGLGWVYFKNRLHRYGQQQIAQEVRLGELRKEIESVDSQIAEWSSRSALQRRLREGFIQLVKINDESIVRLNTRQQSEPDTVRAVANRSGGLR